MNPAVLSSQTSLFIAFLASILIWLMFLGLLILFLVDGKLKKEQAFHAFLSTLAAWVIVSMIKELFPIPRPFVLNRGSFFTISVFHGDGSFPSAHAAVAFAIATSVFLHSKKLGFIFMISALGVGIGRVISNVHYPMDVLFGGLIGTTTSYLSQNMHIRSLFRRGKSRKST